MNAKLELVSGIFFRVLMSSAVPRAHAWAKPWWTGGPDLTVVIEFPQ